MITGMPDWFCQLALQMFITFVELLCVIKSIQYSKYLDYLLNNSLFVVFTLKENGCLCGSCISLSFFSSGKKSHKQKRWFHFIWCSVMHHSCGSSKLLDVRHCSEWERVGQSVLSGLNNPWLCKECSYCLPGIILIIIIIINLYCSHFLKCYSVGDLPSRWGPDTSLYRTLL